MKKMNAGGMGIGGVNKVLKESTTNDNDNDRYVRDTDHDNNVATGFNTNPDEQFGGDLLKDNSNENEHNADNADTSYNSQGAPSIWDDNEFQREMWRNERANMRDFFAVMQ